MNRTGSMTIFEEGDVNRSEDDGQSEDQRQQREACDGNVYREDEAHCLAHVVVSSAALAVSR